MRNIIRTALSVMAVLLALGVRAEGNSVPAHDFHVSITDMRYNPENRRLEVAIKIFTDDLETALEGLGAPKLRLNTDREHRKSDSLIGRYLANRMQIKVNGDAVTGNFLGKEYETDATWCYIEFIAVPQPETIVVSNRLLFERFDDQSNLVHIEVGAEKKSMLLHVGQDRDKATFSED